jgi:uncharacterized protein (TIGR03435 family)
MKGLAVVSLKSTRNQWFVFALFRAVIFLGSSIQPLAAQTSQDIAGTWQGTLPVGNGIRIVLKISKADDGGWKGMLFNPDQPVPGVGVQSITAQGSAFKFSVATLNASYEGTISPDGSSIQGTFTSQGKSPPLNFVRATADTAWAIPQPLEPMATDAKPVFSVATIKPSVPGRQSKMIAGLNGRHILMRNTNLSDLIAFAYQLDAKQIVGAPTGSDDRPYDIDGVADVDGRPDVQQMQWMFQELLASRFKLVFHREKRNLPVYAILVAKGGPKLIKSASAASDYTEFSSNTGEIRITNKSMAEIAGLMRFVVDRPVVDQTGLAGRFDFVLKWTPDGAETSDPNAPPELFTAIQEQLGLKLEPVKAPVDVLVIDHVERPSEN